MAIEAQSWHPLIAQCAVVAGGAPRAVVLMGEALVVWRDSRGEAHVWRDQCPHRGAQLSMGRVLEDRLECPYHGWQFGGDGHCKLIPAAPQFQAPENHCVKQFQTQQAYGLIWASLGEPRQPLPLFEQELDERLRKVLCGPYEVETSAPRIVENFLDMAHFGFVHEHWLGDREHTEMRGYQVQEDEKGFLATECFAWQPKSSVHATQGSMVEYTYQVPAPYTSILTKIPQAEAVAIANFSEAIALFVLPITPEQSRVWFRLAMNDFESLDEKLTGFQDTIFSQDKPIVESQRPKCLPLASGAELHGPADRSSSAYRRYLSRVGVRFGVIPIETNS